MDRGVERAEKVTESKTRRERQRGKGRERASRKQNKRLKQGCRHGAVDKALAVQARGPECGAQSPQEPEAAAHICNPNVPTVRCEDRDGRIPEALRPPNLSHTVTKDRPSPEQGGRWLTLTVVLWPPQRSHKSGESTSPGAG